MDKNDDELQLAIYRPPSFTGGCLEIRLFYVRVAPCAVDNLPDQLKLRHLRRELGVSLEINGVRIPSSEAASITLRRDRIDKDSSEVTYVSTDCVKISGPAEFEVCGERDDVDLILCGSLQRADAAAAWSNGKASDNDLKIGWSLECYVATSITNGRSALLQPKVGICSPSIEVYIAGCCSGSPVILTKTVLISPRRKVLRQGTMLDAIPEDEEIGKEHRSSCNGLVRQRKLQYLMADIDDYEPNGKVGYNYYNDMYPGEDGQLSWFNAGVRVGVGIGLGMCLGVGIGIGLLMRSYQATTRSFTRRFF
ncbi:hypothetical protein CDL12_13703 [Handroanthus impetiginosus]|uniref:Uncharacterized protein n=1 Tax=Handroanthus impetiginosus TaxID=429701 RepID=A0A2G9H817_9LAMI|nr:hypothetical protein CDL12_13703 [Handroanthus impetiginosus]